MKKIIFLLIYLLPLVANAQTGLFSVKVGEQNGVKNKTFDLKDKRDFPDFSEYNHPDGFYFDTVIYANLTTAEWHKNIKTWLAVNFNSLPNVLKLDDTDHIIIHSVYDLHNFTLDYRMKDGKTKILLTDFISQETEFSQQQYPIIYYYNKYVNNDYNGGKKRKYGRKKMDLIHLNDFQTIADWIRNKCIASIDKNNSDF